MKRWSCEPSHEKIPLAENPSFEGGSAYETFGHSGENIEVNQVDNAIEMLDDVLYDVSDDENQIDEDERFDQNLMESLPSTQLRKLRGIASSGTMRHRVQGVELLDLHDQQDYTVSNEVDVDEVAIHGLGASNVNQIKDMTTTFDRKKSVRLRVHENEKRGRPISGWQNFKYENAMKWVGVKNHVADSFSSMDLWKDHMKKIQGLFGTGVLAYFSFLRWLLYINLLVSLLTVSFLFVPQIIFNPSSKNNTESFTGLELLTGEGWLTHSELYYGQYTNEKIDGVYEMKYAYLLVGGGYVLICIIALAASMAKSYKQNYIDGGEAFSTFSSKVFCSWDYGISNKETAEIKKGSIAQDIMETLGSNRERNDRTCCSICYIVMLRLVTNIVTLGLMAGSVFLIFYVSEYALDGFLEKKDDSNHLIGLLPAITISAVNLIMPSAFRLIASIENYEYAQSDLWISLLRTAVLKLASLIAYVVTLHTELNKKQDVIRSDEGVCWETYIGQAFYKLIIIDFLFVLLSTFFGEFIRDVFAQRVSCCTSYRPGFDVSKNVLNLIYAQGICWLGTFYSPLLPVINVLKLIIVFYVKVISVPRNCRPSMRPFKASKMSVIFIALLSLMLILSLVVVGYVIMNEDALRPSHACGPFRGTQSIFSVVWNIINADEILERIVNVVSSLSVIAGILFFICLLAYYFRMRKQSSEKKIKLLKHQLALAGQDKQYLIKKLRQILAQPSHVQ